MGKRRLLICLAHPDDESFGMGGMIAHYVDAGVDVYYLCATNGDVGTVAPEYLNGYKSIKELRLAELDCATQVLGFKQVFLAGYSDSGMMNDAANQNPNCLWHNWQTHPGEVTRRVVDVIREVQPQVVVTFDRYGGYGHPDHIAIQQATTEAFHLAGKADYATDGQPPYQPQKLYFHVFPKNMLRPMVLWMRIKGQDVRKMGTNQDIDFQAILEHEEPIHTKLNVGKYLADWDNASACHASQGGGIANRWPVWLRRLLMANQSFRRVYPVPDTDRVDEHDLFADVATAERE